MNTLIQVQQHEIEAFIFREARLLDERRFEEWYELFTEDAHVWVPSSLGQKERNHQISIVNDDLELLDFRIKRLRHSQIHSQTPPARAVRLISNIFVDETDDENSEVTVHSTFAMVEYRLREQRLFAGHYEHRLRRDGEAWKIAAKKVSLLNCDGVFSNLGLPF